MRSMRSMRGGFISKSEPSFTEPKKQSSMILILDSAVVRRVMSGERHDAYYMEIQASEGQL